MYIVVSCIMAGERSHTIEKKCNTKTNEKEESQHFINLDEGEYFLPSESILITVRSNCMFHYFQINIYIHVDDQSSVFI